MQNFIEQIQKCENLNDLEAIRISVLGKKGILTEGFTKLKELEDDAKKEFAAKLNAQKEIFNEAYLAKFKDLENLALEERMKQGALNFNYFDENITTGALHPVMSTMDKIIEYFIALNFSIEKGPLIEDDFHNFEALNLPKSHPARDMQDTFYFDDKRLLRTQTSPVQIRTMLAQKPPIRMIAPGAVFRRDFDITHTPMF
ncbi:phenylalanine--tRNA ligase subunit alpha, partial [Campylobacter jejuni]